MDGYLCLLSHIPSLLTHKWYTHTHQVQVLLMSPFLLSSSSSASLASSLLLKSTSLPSLVSSSLSSSSSLHHAGHSQAAPCWSAALSRALCLVRKLQGSAASSKADSPKPRILCIDGSPDVPSQYIAVMNAIFSAQVPALASLHCMPPCFTDAVD